MEDLKNLQQIFAKISKFEEEQRCWVRNTFSEMKSTILLIFFLETIVAINVKELKDLRQKLFDKINKQLELESTSNRRTVYNLILKIKF